MHLKSCIAHIRLDSNQLRHAKQPRMARPNEQHGGDIGTCDENISEGHLNASFYVNS